MDELIEAFEAYQEAKKEYTEACIGCQYDKGYYLQEERQKVDSTKEALSKCFEKTILHIVESKLEIIKLPK